MLFFGGGDRHMISDLQSRVFVCIQSPPSFVTYIVNCLWHGSSLRDWPLLFSTSVIATAAQENHLESFKKKNTMVSKLHPLSVLRELELHQDHLEGVLKHTLLGSTPRVSESVGPGLEHGYFQELLLMLLVQNHI